jgi:flavin-binding protein dodecin
MNAVNTGRWAFHFRLLTLDGLGLNVSEEIYVSKGGLVVESVYKVVELVGTSSDSWEKAASAAVMQAGRSLRDLRVAEVSELDLTIENGKVASYRAKVKVSFKYEGGD